MAADISSMAVVGATSVAIEHRADIEGRMADLKATLEEIRAYETEARGLLKKQGG